MNFILTLVTAVILVLISIACAIVLVLETIFVRPFRGQDDDEPNQRYSDWRDDN